MNTLPLHQKDEPVHKFKLMLKQHYETGVNYLCITKREKWQKYKGSGISWKKLIKKHKSKILTTLIFTSDDIDFFNKICIKYSRLFDVVNNPDFANLIVESGYNFDPDIKRNIKPYFSKLTGTIGGIVTKENRLGIFDPELQCLRKQWAEIGAKALEISGNRKGCATKEWIKNNKEKQKVNASKGGKIGGSKTGKMFWWNNGETNTKAFECPGENWVRGMLMSEKKRQQVLSKFIFKNRKVLS